jgi:serpin B
LVTGTAFLFRFPYEPTQPPGLDDTGATQEGVDEVIEGNNQFGFEFFNKVNEENQDENVFFSPYSLYSAFTMVYEGARSETAEEISSVFHFPSLETLRPNFASVYNDINSGSDKYELRTGNALWVQKDYQLLEEYLSNVERYYGGKASNLDFVNEPEKSRETINTFIEEQTNNRIEDLIPKGVLGAMTRVVLTNAVYFKGDWVWEFDEKDTRDMDFHISLNETVQTPMMNMEPAEAEFNYADLNKLKILELPYKGEKLSMLILLPKQGQSYDVETGKSISYNYTLDDIELSAQKLEEYKSEMKETKLDKISLPKFEFETKYFLVDTLKEMGMPSAFGNADFSGIDGTKNLVISDVIHQAFVKVDEKGTEAAAATAIVMKETSAMIQRNEFIADHPFIFLIQDKETGNILFFGKMKNPKK